jgi:hypothetical protein
MHTNIRMEKIKDILSDFEPITLKEMDGVKLMDRTDTKYVFRLDSLVAFLEQVKTDYRILVVNDHRISRYESLYFDTKNFDLYMCHHRGRLNRYKIRCRKYVESELHFFEVKFKNLKGRTIKDRVKQKLIDGLINEKAENLLNEKTPLKAAHLEAKLWVNYSRITLVNKISPERVTIDVDLVFKNSETNKSIDNLVIAEVKQEKAMSSSFVRLMKKHHIREGSMSKYCFGVISLFNTIKHNNFKPKLIQLKKTLNGTTRNT